LEPFYEALGKRIQGFRKRAKLTQADLGERLHPPLTRASVANIENGKQRVLAHTAVELAEVLNVSLDDLLPRPRKTTTPVVDAESLERELGVKLSLSKADARAMAATIAGARRT
jgi:transcriptional regulator with XRE-family HTH domain